MRCVANGVSYNTWFLHKLVAYYYLRIQILVIWKIITKSVGINFSDFT